MEEPCISAALPIGCCCITTERRFLCICRVQWCTRAAAAGASTCGRWRSGARWPSLFYCTSGCGGSHGRWRASSGWWRPRRWTTRFSTIGSGTMTARTTKATRRATGSSRGAGIPRGQQLATAPLVLSAVGSGSSTATGSTTATRRATKNSRDLCRGRGVALNRDKILRCDRQSDLARGLYGSVPRVCDKSILLQGQSKFWFLLMHMFILTPGKTRPPPHTASSQQSTVELADTAPYPIRVSDAAQKNVPLDHPPLGGSTASAPFSSSLLSFGYDQSGWPFRRRAWQAHNSGHNAAGRQHWVRVFQLPPPVRCRLPPRRLACVLTATALQLV